MYKTEYTVPKRRMAEMTEIAKNVWFCMPIALAVQVEGGGWHIICISLTPPRDSTRYNKNNLDAILSNYNQSKNSGVKYVRISVAPSILSALYFF